MRILLSLLLASLAALPVYTTDWALIVKDTLAKSVVPIERNTAGTSCTGFVIHANAKRDDKDVDYVLTAAHCEAAKMYADQAEARLVAKNTEKDLMVLAVEDLDRPALKVAKEDPHVGDQVASYGYGYGLEKPLFRLTNISAKTYIPFDGIGGPIFFTDTTFVPGMSGGPVVNTAGEVVMIVQMGTESVGIGVGAEVIRDKVGRYIQRVP